VRKIIDSTETALPSQIITKDNVVKYYNPDSVF